MFVCVLLATMGCRKVTQSGGEFNAAYDAAYAKASDAKNSAGLLATCGPLWNELDALVLDQLNNGGARDQLTTIFTALHGYREEQPGEPTYGVLPLTTAAGDVLLGVYSLGIGSPSCSRLSVFREFDGHWSRLDSRDREDRVFAYSIPRVTGQFLSATLVFGADGSSGDVQTWRIDDGRLVETSPARKLLNWELIDSQKDVRLAFQASPQCLAMTAADMQTSSTFLLTVRADGDDAVATETASTVPWVVAVDAVCSAARQPRATVPSAVQASASELRDGWAFQAQQGDVTKGTGSVDVCSSDLQHCFRFIVRRTPAGNWRVERVEPLRSPSHR